MISNGRSLIAAVLLISVLGVAPSLRGQEFRLKKTVELAVDVRSVARLSPDGKRVLYVKRLERGRFVWPQAASGVVHLSTAQLSMLLEGIDWRRPQRTTVPMIAA